MPSRYDQICSQPQFTPPGFIALARIVAPGHLHRGPSWPGLSRLVADDRNDAWNAANDANDGKTGNHGKTGNDNNPAMTAMTANAKN